MKPLSTLLICLLFFSNANIKAQEKQWSLNECIDKALESNLSIKQSEINSQSVSNSYEQSKWSFSPTLNGSASQFYQYGRSIDRFSNQFVNQTIRSNNFSLNASLIVFNGLQNQNNLQSARFSWLGSQKDLEVMQNNISLQTGNLFLQALLAKENLANVENAIKNTKIQLERAEKLVAAGVSNEGTVLNLKATLAGDQLNIANAQGQLKLALTNLKLYLQLREDESFDIKAPEISGFRLIKSDSLSVPAMYDYALSNRPEIKSAEYYLEGSNYQLKSSKAGFMPTVSVGANMNSVYSQNAKNLVSSTKTGQAYEIGYVNNATLDKVLTPVILNTFETIPFNKQLKNNFGQSIAFNLNVPIFNPAQTRYGVRSAKLSFELNKIKLEQAKNTLYSDISTAVVNYNVAFNKYNAATQNLDARNLNFEYQTKRYDAGVSNLLEYTQAKNDLNGSQVSFLQTKYELIFRMLIIEFYKGNKIGF